MVRLVMVGQAFQEVSKEHCVAVALGLVPMLAAWALQLVDLSLHKGRFESVRERAEIWG